jgi:DNA-directed RNA polymerase subunit RPC12/RpoP
MGMPNRLHGKLIKLPLGKEATCTKCKKKYRNFKLTVKNDIVYKVCPHCKHEIRFKGKLPAP